MLVQDTDLEMVIGSGITTIGLGTGMSDLGEPPVSAGFSEEVALSRRVWGSCARLVATIDSAGSGAGESQKADSVDSARERSQLRQPRSNNVPSGSQQADRWQDMLV